MKRLADEIVPLGLRIAWRRATWPTSRSPCSVKATTDGVVRDPSALGITVGWPPSTVAMTELVVPRSMPTALAMMVPPGARARDDLSTDRAGRIGDAPSRQQRRAVVREEEGEQPAEEESHQDARHSPATGAPPRVEWAGDLLDDDGVPAHDDHVLDREPPMGKAIDVRLRVFVAVERRDGLTTRGVHFTNDIHRCLPCDGPDSVV